jgi:MFS transporter, FSR family, fosmidomycin resistance protein
MNKAGWKTQGPAFLVGAGHGATHWIIATFYVLLPFLSKELGLSYTQTGGLVSLFHGSAFLANIGSGAVVDISGRRVLVQAVAIIIGASALASIGLATSAVWLLAPVIFIGITNNLWHPAAISYLSRKYPNSRGLALSIHTLGASFGDILAPVVAGSLLLTMSWQQTAVINALPVFVVAVILWMSLKEIIVPSKIQHETSPKPDYLSSVATLLRNSSLIGLCIMSGFRAMTQNGLLLFIPLYLVAALKANPLMLGLALMAFQAGGIIAGPLAGSWSDRIGRQPVVLTGLTATSILVLGITFVETLLPFIILVSLLGFALFSLRPVIHSWVMDMADDEMSGTAISVLFSAQSAFTFAVPILGGIIADAWGLKMVFYLLTLTIVIATLISVRLPRPQS